MPDEEILDPDLLICDPHHHLWDTLGKSYAYPRYLLDELLADLGAGHRVVTTVFVEANAFYSADKPGRMAPVGETEFAAGVAAMTESGVYGNIRACAGIVAFADLTIGGGVTDVLAAHQAAAGGRLRGVRYSGACDPSPDTPALHTRPTPHLYRDTVFREGFARLAEFGLSFDAFLFHPQMDDVIELARAFPETPIMINHIGAPLGVGAYANDRAAVFERWRKTLQAAARCPNLYIKVGGMGMRLMGFGFAGRATPPTSTELADAWRPYVEACLEAFGTDRAMFESNFPVDAVSCDYRTLWNAFKRITQGASDDERRAVFHDNATNFYRLERA